MILGVAIAAACSRERAAPPTPTHDPVVRTDDAGVRDAAGGGAAASDVATPPIGDPAEVPLAYTAIRCSECHNKMYDEWTTSAHARASSSDTYQRMRRDAKDAACDGCHAPLAARLGTDRVVTEGVTCDVCHNIKAVELQRTGSTFPLELDDRVKYGPLCDAEDHYFHRMGCSPLHQQSKLCAACHLYYRVLPGGGELPVFTEHDEWKAGPYKNRSCQTCHMPGSRAEVANGEGERDGVSNHGLLGATGELRKRALRAKARISVVDGKLAVTVDVHNVQAGHHVPTGLPARRIIVRATTITAEGALHASAERRFGRHLVDARGAPAPFYLATAVAADDRIAPKQAQQASLVVAAPAQGELQLEVAWRALDPDIAARLAIDEVDEQTLLKATVALAPARGLPRTVELAR